MDKELRLKYYTRQEILNEFNINVDVIRISIQTMEIPLLMREFLDILMVDIYI